MSVSVNFVTTQTMKKALILALSTLALSAKGLDVEVTDYECDSSLYVTADFQVKCDGSSKCTFGKSTAEVSGTRKLQCLIEVHKRHIFLADSFVDEISSL